MKSDGIINNHGVKSSRGSFFFFFLGPKMQVHSTAHNGVVFPRGTVTRANLGASLFSGERYREQRKSRSSEPTQRNTLLNPKAINPCIQFFKSHHCLKKKQFYYQKTDSFLIVTIKNESSDLKMPTLRNS